jgi:hypothetical protein
VQQDLSRAPSLAPRCNPLSSHYEQLTLPLPAKLTHFPPTAPPPPLPAGCPLALRDPLVDVRVAAWLGTPDDKRLRDEREASVAAARCAPFTVNDMLKCAVGACVVEGWVCVKRKGGGGGQGRGGLGLRGQSGGCGLCCVGSST